jgi:hypothetical protein
MQLKNYLILLTGMRQFAYFVGKMTRMKEARGQIELLRYELPAASVPVS